MSREIDLKGRPLPRRAVNPNVSIALFNDAIHGCKPKSRALPAFFGSEEWLKDMCERCRIHSRSRIAHAQNYVIPNSRSWMTSRVRFVESHVSRLDLQLSAVRH